MKKALILFFFVGVFLSACSGFENSTIYDRKVRYFSSTILNAERNIITLANQTVWETDRYATLVNMSPVFVVLDENINAGDLFAGNSKYGIHGGLSEDFFYQYGYYQIMTKYDSVRHVITLLNNSEWEIPKEFSRFVQHWQNGSEVVITENEKFMINARRREKIPVRRIKN